MPNECVKDQLDLESADAKDRGRYNHEIIRHMSNEDKYKLMRQGFRPSSTYRFPVPVAYLEGVSRCSETLRYVGRGRCAWALLTHVH